VVHDMVIQVELALDDSVGPSASNDQHLGVEKAVGHRLEVAAQLAVLSRPLTLPSEVGQVELALYSPPAILVQEGG